jgi:hypothetical protein
VLIEHGQQFVRRCSDRSGDHLGSPAFGQDQGARGEFAIAKTGAGVAAD